MEAILLLARYEFHLVVETPLLLPPFYGQPLRGGLSTVMRKTVCITHMPVCDGCLLRRQCSYGILFEPIPPPAYPDQRYANTPAILILKC